MRDDDSEDSISKASKSTIQLQKISELEKSIKTLQASHDAMVQQMAYFEDAIVALSGADDSSANYSKCKKVAQNIKRKRSNTKNNVTKDEDSIEEKLKEKNPSETQEREK